MRASKSSRSVSPLSVGNRDSRAFDPTTRKNVPRFAPYDVAQLATAPDAKAWLAGITWKLTPDAIYELALPHADYWEQVQADRLLTARQKGAVDWDRESLERHFSDTNPGELVVDFEDTGPPKRAHENLRDPPTA